MWCGEHPDAPMEYDYKRESGRKYNAETMQLEEPGQSKNVEQVKFALGDIGGKNRIVDMTKEEREEQEKVWRLALQSIDQARRANAPGHETNASKPISGANLGKIP